MPEARTQFGKLIAVHPISPAAMQRAVFIAVLAFLFFLAMMLAFYIRQDLGYFVLASVFLVVYLLMMFSLIMKRRSAVEIYENGFRHGKSSYLWADIAGVSDDGDVETSDARHIVLPKSLNDFDQMIATLRSRAALQR